MTFKPRWFSLLGLAIFSLLSVTLASSALAQEAILTARDPSSAINIRSAPSTQAAAPAYGLVGDRVAVLNQTQGNDGYQWYRVRFQDSQTEGWVRGDFVTLVNPTPAVNPTPQLSPGPVAQPDRPPDGYSQEQINYFLAVALGGEFGNSSAAIRKWQGDVRIKYFGSPTSDDLSTLETVIADVNELTHGSIQLELVDTNPNIEIYFVPESSFSRYEPNYRPRNLGFFWTWWNRDNILNRARVLITTDGVTQQERSHLIREELTQSLGLMQDSYAYRSSIFYQGWTDVTQYTELDKTLISLLYRPEVQPGMTRSQVLATLNTLRRVQDTPLEETEQVKETEQANDRPPLDFSLPEIDHP
ncbi:MAG: DUF2927 domain-containing protein [Oculatellaceae cyanobacterium bins.114]|nr:DUF2927 domain-containing protein [Oculatellaceae cyanobacterium bins.114]